MNKHVYSVHLSRQACNCGGQGGGGEGGAGHLVQVSDHVALALDGTLPQRDEFVGLGLQALHHGIADMHAAGEAVALHAAGHIHCVSQEAVPRALHANHTGIGRSTVHTCIITSSWCHNHNHSRRVIQVCVLVQEQGSLRFKAQTPLSLCMTCCKVQRQQKFKMLISSEAHVSW